MVCDDLRAVGDVGCNMASLPSMKNNHSLSRKCHRPPVVGAKAADEKTESFAALAAMPPHHGARPLMSPSGQKRT